VNARVAGNFLVFIDINYKIVILFV
jgi:hypothetical protein